MKQFKSYPLLFLLCGNPLLTAEQYCSPRAACGAGGPGRSDVETRTMWRSTGIKSEPGYARRL